MQQIQGDKVLYLSREFVVTDVAPFEGDSSLDRLVCRPADDPDGEFVYPHPDEARIIGHLRDGEVSGWRERGPNDWVRVET